MNHSTEGVTLFAGFLSDLLANYQQERGVYIQPLFAMVEGIDLSNPLNLVPIALYNDMCQWIEQNLGPANLRKAGEFVGVRAYDLMLQQHYITSKATPQEILKALQKVASEAVQDPEGRGWEILELEEKRAVLRRTQTFNPVLQEGLLKALLKRTGQKAIRLRYLKSVRNGDEFDEYEILWYH
jgi:hypothetical protein